MIPLEFIALLFVGSAYGIIGIVLTELDKRTNGK